MQNFIYDTLILAIGRLQPEQHHEFLAKTLTILTDQPDLHQLPVVSLAELLFAVIDSRTEPSQLLRIQNVMIHASQSERGLTC
jgi:hypothetical protein